MNLRHLRYTNTLALAAIATLAPLSAQAAGTALDVQSGRGTGMASAMTAHVDDSSAIYYNPAGIAQGLVLDAQAGLTPLIAGHMFTDTAGTKTSLKFAVVTPFNAYVTAGITENFSVGVGVYTPFGLSLSWPSGWEGRRLITESSNINYYFNPTVAYRFGPLRIGAGFQLVRSTVSLKKDISFGDTEGGVDLGAAAWGVGANVGVQLEAIPQYLNLGVHYRSAVSIDFNDGQAHFSNVPPALQGTLHDQRVTTSLIQPDSLAMGVSSRPLKDLLLAVDVVWFGWSKFRSVNINFPDDASGTLSSVEPKNWSNTVNFRVGAEGNLGEHFRVRGGALYDPSPSPSSTLAPDVPDADRLNLAVGGSYLHGTGFRVDVGYQFLVLFKKTSTSPLLPGDYSGTVNILGVSLGYRFPYGGARGGS